MRQGIVVWLVTFFVVVTFAGNVFGVGGDMGFGTDPCTNGSADHPFLIEDINDFNNFSNDPNYWAGGVHTRLDIDIDLAGEVYNTAVIAPDINSSNWDYDGVAFSGVFDGNEHVVRFITIDVNDMGNDFIGLFGSIGDPNAEVKNLGVEGVNITGKNSSSYIGGLCGTNLGIINNCHSNVIIRYFDDGSFLGATRVGGLCGFNIGVISKSYSTGSVSGIIYIGGLCGNNVGIIDNSYSAGAVTGHYNIGGFCGENGGPLIYGLGAKITNCYSRSEVTGESVVGGFCGRNGVFCIGDDYYDYVGEVINCYSTGAVTVTSVTEYLGGFCGGNTNIISNSFWDVDSSGIGTSGDDNLGATGKATEEMQRVSTFIDAGWDFYNADAEPNWIMPVDDYAEFSWQQSIIFEGDLSANLTPSDSCVIEVEVYSRVEETLGWTIGGEGFCDWISGVDPNSGVSSRPTDKTTVAIEINTIGLYRGNYLCELIIEADNGDSIICPIDLHVSLPGSGTENDPFVIADINDFNSFCNDPNYWAVGVHTRLETDIDLAGEVYRHAVISPDTDIADWRYNGVPFSGIFDGNEHVVSNLTINVTVENYRYLGLFGNIEGVTPEVKNLGVENINITAGMHAMGIGGLCGMNTDGTINNCYSSGVIYGAEDSYSVGGLCGENYGSMINCYSVSLIDCGVDTGYLGGLCGTNVGDINNCFSTGAVIGGERSVYVGNLCGCNGGDGSIIGNSYSIGTVTGHYVLGGLCGGNVAGGAIYNSYSFGDVTGQIESYEIGGLCGGNYGGTIEKSYSFSSVTCDVNSGGIGGLCGANFLGTINNCYSIGSVAYGDGSTLLGGFCGYNNDGEMSNSFWDVNSSGMVVGYNLDLTYPGTVTNVVGKTTGQMQVASTFTDAGWDFDPDDGDAAEWWVNEGRDYPKLGWQPFGDLNNDSHVDMLDVAVMGLAWFSGDGDLNFNSVCELSGDWVIDEADLAELGGMWLAGPGWE